MNDPNVIHAESLQQPHMVSKPHETITMFGAILTEFMSNFVKSIAQTKQCSQLHSDVLMGKYGTYFGMIFNLAGVLQPSV